MKILFVCGSLEPGKDGVGDYVRRLGGELTRQGHEVLLLGLIDPRVSAIERRPGSTADEQGALWRLPAQVDWAERSRQLRKAVTEFSPDWISLQYVPWTFSRKGCSSTVAKVIRSAVGPGTRIQIMFHELWIGSFSRDPLKERLLGWLQRRTISEILRILRPECCHTSNAFYAMRLAPLFGRAQVLPLFGNIPIHSSSRPSPLKESLGAERGSRLLAGVFGTVHPGWDPIPALQDLEAHGISRGRRIALAFIGRNGAYSAKVQERLRDALADRLDVIVLGELGAEELSSTFSDLDFGFAASPLGLIGKSGSAIAMLEHGLPLLVTRSDIVPPADFSVPEHYLAKHAILFEKDDFDWQEFLRKRPQVHSVLPEVAKQFTDRLCK